VVLSKKQLAAIHAQDQERRIEGLKKSGQFIQTNVNTDGKEKDWQMWIADMKTHQKVEGSDTIVRSKHGYGQAVDDFIPDWNKKKRMGKTIGYPVVQGKLANDG